MTSEIQDQNRNRILDAAEKLLREVGRDTVTVRAVADAAGVQLPTIYRLFADKADLLDAVAERGFVRYMEIDPSPDGSQDIPVLLRHGWDIHVRFGREHPELYGLMFGAEAARATSKAGDIALKGLMSLIDKAAATGYLRVSREEAALKAFSSASGVVLALQFLPKNGYTESYLAKVRDAVLSSIAKMEPPSGPPEDHGKYLAAAASTLAANLEKIETLSPAERNMMSEWLGKIG